jgi:hypothetical protein
LQSDKKLPDLKIFRPFDEGQGDEVPIKLIRVYSTKEQHA